MPSPREMMTNESHFHHFLLEDMMLKHELKVIKCNLSHFAVKTQDFSSHQYLNYKFLNGEISTFTMGNDILIGHFISSDGVCL